MWNVMRDGWAAMELVPACQVTLEEQENAGVVYQSQGDDPQFRIEVQGGIGRLSPGWYLIRISIASLEGEIASPALYPDYGEGASEATKIDLPEPGAAGGIFAVVCFSSTLKTLRFDPTITQSRFSVANAELLKVSRIRALTEMLGAIRRLGGQRSFGEKSPPLIEFVRRGLVGGKSEALGYLIARYRASLNESTFCYARWLRMYGNASPSSDSSESGLAGRADGPLISIVMPTHCTPVSLLRKAIDSVIAQTYDNWQLCIADDASSPVVRDLLSKYAELDRRIVVHLRDERGHICKASNDALALADGEYIGFLDHDDELTADALDVMARAIGHHASAGIFYSDEDKIGLDGSLCEPNFKPGWNPDLMRSQNYMCHFVVIRKALIHEAGGFRCGFEGAQDHDLLLRCIERTSADGIVHVPKVLYHWRMMPGSTALGVGQKSYALEAGCRAIEEHLARTGVRGHVTVNSFGHYRIHRELDARPDVCIVIPTRDRVDLLRTCVQSVLENTEYRNFRVLVIDNGSTDIATIEYLKSVQEHAQVDVVEYSAPFNFSAIVNFGVSRSKEELICILNNDTEVISDGWLTEMVQHAVRKEVGVVGCMLYYPDATIQHAGVVLGFGGIAGHAHLRLPRGSAGYVGRAAVVQNYMAVTGAAMMVRRTVFEQVGGFYEGLGVAFNDIDFCMRVAVLGYWNVWTPFCELYHHESASRGLDDAPEKRARFMSEVDMMRRRWGDVLDNDPAYNPNLALNGRMFSLSFPPRARSQSLARRGGFSGVAQFGKHAQATSPSGI